MHVGLSGSACWLKEKKKKINSKIKKQTSNDNSNKRKKKTNEKEKFKINILFLAPTYESRRKYERKGMEYRKNWVK